MADCCGPEGNVCAQIYYRGEGWVTLAPTADPVEACRKAAESFCTPADGPQPAQVRVAECRPTEERNADRAPVGF